MKTVIIIQARMTSTRLPGKVLKTVMGKSLLEYLIERVNKVRMADEIIIATTINEEDQPIIDLCEQLNVSYFRGSELDVLARYYGAASQYGAKVIVRVTSDCPVIDPHVIDSVISYYLESFPRYDYVSNRLISSFPRGMDTEVFSFKVLEEANLEAKQEPEREHVTPFIYWQPERYQLGNVNFETDESYHRWTVDTEEDFQLINEIIRKLYPQNRDFGIHDILNLFKEKPYMYKINAHVKQKEVINSK